VWAFVFERGRGVRLGRLAVSSAVGLGLWVASFPLQYWLALGVWKAPSLLTVFGARTSWSVVESSSSAGIVAGVALRACTNLVDLLEGLFTSVPYLFHQCFIPPYPGVPPRTVVWLVTPFVVVETLRTLVRRGSVGSVLLVLWALVGLVPAVFSAEGYPKRASIAYPALMALGAIGMTGVLREISSLGGRLLRTSIGVAAGFAALAYVAAASHQWFSGRIYPYGEPSEMAIARSVESMLRPGTLVVGDYWNHYYEGKFGYLLIDALRKREVRPSAYHVFGRPAVPLEQILEDPGVVVRKLHKTIWYRWTALWNDLPAIRARQRWSHVLFLFQRESPGERHIPIRERLERVKQLCPGGKMVVLDDPRVDRRFTLFRCRLSRRLTSEPGAPSLKHGLLSRPVFHHQGTTIRLGDLPLAFNGALVLWLFLICGSGIFLFLLDRDLASPEASDGSEGRRPTVALTALGAAFCGQWMLAQGQTTLGLVLFALGGGALVSSTPSPGTATLFSKRGKYVFLGGLTLVALALRVYRLNEAFPTGIEQDEYGWILEYLSILMGRSPFGVQGFGIPVLHGVTNVASILVLGLSPVSIRAISPLVGALTVLPVYFIGKWLFGGTVGVFAALMITVSSYHVFYSRIISGARMTLTVALCFACLAGAWRLSRTLLDARAAGGFFFAGALGGLAFHDYFAVRWVPVFLGVTSVIGALWAAKARRGGMYLAALVLFIVPFAAMVAPLVFQFAADPDQFVRRMRAESVIGRFMALDLPFVGAQVKRVFLMLNVLFPEGRWLWFSLPDVAVMSFFPAALLGLGFFGLVGALLLGSVEALLVLLAFVLSLTPTLFSTSAPDTHRAVLVNLPAAIIVGWAVGRLASVWGRKHLRGVCVVLGGGLCLAALVTLHGWYRSSLFEERNLFHSHWYRRIQALERVIPRNARTRIGARTLYPGAVLAVERDDFNGVELLFGEMRRVQWSASHLFPTLPPGLRIIDKRAAPDDPMSPVEALYPHARIIKLPLPGTAVEELVRIDRANQGRYRCGTGERCRVGDREFRGLLYVPVPEGVPGESTVSVRIDSALNCRLVGENASEIRTSTGRMESISILCPDPASFDDVRLIVQEEPRHSSFTLRLRDLIAPSVLPIWHGEALFSDGTKLALPDLPVPWSTWTRGLGFRMRHALENGKTLHELRFWSDDGDLLRARQWAVFVPVGNVELRVDGATLFERTNSTGEHVPVENPPQIGRIEVNLRGLDRSLRFLVAPERSLAPSS
jgi:hypothetical protein